MHDISVAIIFFKTENWKSNFKVMNEIIFFYRIVIWVVVWGYKLNFCPLHGVTWKNSID